MNFSSLLNNNLLSSYSINNNTIEYIQPSFSREHSENHSSLIRNFSMIFSGNIITHDNFNAFLRNADHDVYNNNRNDNFIFY